MTKWSRRSKSFFFSRITAFKFTLNTHRWIVVSCSYEALSKRCPFFLCGIRRSVRITHEPQMCPKTWKNIPSSRLSFPNPLATFGNLPSVATDRRRGRTERTSHPGPSMTKDDSFPLRFPTSWRPGFRMWTTRPVS